MTPPPVHQELAMAPSSSAVLCLKATDGAEVEHGWTVLIFMLHILMLIEKKKTCYVLQSCPILCNPMDCRPPGSSVHEDSPGKNTGVGCHALLQGIFLTQGSNLVSYVSRGSLPLAPPGKPLFTVRSMDKEARCDWNSKCSESIRNVKF